MGKKSLIDERGNRWERTPSGWEQVDPNHEKSMKEMYKRDLQKYEDLRRSGVKHRNALGKLSDVERINVLSQISNAQFGRLKKTNVKQRKKKDDY